MSDFVGGQFAMRPKDDPLALYAKAQEKAAMDAVTEELLRDYKVNHLLSRGAAVGSA